MDPEEKDISSSIKKNLYYMFAHAFFLVLSLILVTFLLNISKDLVIQASYDKNVALEEIEIILQKLEEGIITKDNDGKLGYSNGKGQNVLNNIR